MFSYRHAFHAGNHADVLKHTVLISAMHYLAQKEVGYTAIDTHSGPGLYKLDSPDAKQSGEAQEGLLALIRNKSKLFSTLFIKSQIPCLYYLPIC